MTTNSRLLVAFSLLVAAAAADPAIAGVGRFVEDPPPKPGEQGAPGSQCTTFVVFTAPDGCSTCSCSVDARMTDCTRSTCPDPGNYTLNECVENALYAGSDGCNSCQCNAWRSFSSCTRNICLLSDAAPSTSPPPRRPLRPTLPTQRPPLAGPTPSRRRGPPRRRPDSSRRQPSSTTQEA